MACEQKFHNISLIFVKYWNYLPVLILCIVETPTVEGLSWKGDLGPDALFQELLFGTRASVSMKKIHLFWN